MQQELNFSTNNSWAFIKDPSRNYSIRKSFKSRGRNVHDYIVSSCSREARAFGVKAGMRYEKAKQLIPEMRVFVIGSSRL